MDSLAMTCIIGLVTLYVYVKGIVWWALFGGLRRLLGVITHGEFVRMTSRCLNAGVAVLAADAVLGLLLATGGWLGTLALLLTVSIGAAVMVSETLTLFGLLRGDWSFRNPRFRVWGLFRLHVTEKSGHRRNSGYSFIPKMDYDLYRRALDEAAFDKAYGYK